MAQRLIEELNLPGGRATPVLGVDSRRPGPCVVVTANLHGDELTGTAATHQLVPLLARLLRRGRVWLYPSLNPAGLAACVRGIPGEDLDPNRAFPGTGSGAVSRHARALWENLLGRRPDLLIDLHTDAVDAIPYALVDRVVRGDRGLEGRAVQLAEASGLLVLREYPPEQYLRYSLDASLPGALMNGPGIAAVTLEIGPRRGVLTQAVSLAVEATLGVMSALGIVDAPATIQQGLPEGGPWRRDGGPKLTRGGLLVPLLRAGSRFWTGDILSQVHALDGEVLESLRVAQDGFVVSLPDRSWANPGLVSATIAVREG